LQELTFVVNPASGGRRGRWLLARLHASVSGARVVELPGTDLARLADQARDAGAALVACGGDGTAAALLEAAWQSHRRKPVAAPPAVGVIPLGTGNDLARSLGWAGAAPSEARLAGLIAGLGAAVPRPLDRWLLQGPGWQRSWFNYWSTGIDARIAGRFHRFRLRHPLICRHRLVNQALYAGLGGGEPGNPLASWARRGDGGSLPSWASALVVASIPSYAGGVRLSPRIRADDGRAELFALAHGLALGLATSGVRRPQCLGSVATLELRLDRAAAMQLDGEPLAAPAGVYRLRREGQVLALASTGVPRASG
jgi:diacylglycerol kinase (ATP)